MPATGARQWTLNLSRTGPDSTSMVRGGVGALGPHEQKESTTAHDADCGHENMAALLLLLQALDGRASVPPRRTW